jgi:hypothetical protein
MALNTNLLLQTNLTFLKFKIEDLVCIYKGCIGLCQIWADEDDTIKLQNSVPLVLSCFPQAAWQVIQLLPLPLMLSMQGWAHNCPRTAYRCSARPPCFCCFCRCLWPAAVVASKGVAITAVWGAAAAVVAAAANFMLAAVAATAEKVVSATASVPPLVLERSYLLLTHAILLSFPSHTYAPYPSACCPADWQGACCLSSCAWQSRHIRSGGGWLALEPFSPTFYKCLLLKMSISVIRAILHLFLY